MRTRTIILGLVATAAIAAPLVAATSAQAANNLNYDPTCTPVAEIFAAPAETHTEYKYVGAGSTKWSRDSHPTLIVGSVTYNAEYYTNGALKGQHKTQTVIDVPAVQAVDGTTCVIPIPAFPSDLLALTQPTDTDKYTWSSITNHIASNGKVGIVATAKPGYVFTYNGTTMASKTFTLSGVKQFSYVDNFGDVTCNEISYPTYDAIACTFNGFTMTPGTTGETQWQSDFGNRANLGTMTYTVNAAGTGYTGQATYPNG